MALLRVDPGLLIWLWITFGIVLLILRFTVWGRIIGALDKRSDRIASDLDAARRAGEKATSVLAEYEQKIREGRAEAARIIEGARADASRLREEMLRQMQQEAAEIRERAKADVERAREDAEKALRGQVVSLSFSIADALLKRETATGDNRAFVEEFAERLTARGAAGGSAPGAGGPAAGTN
jgi:F-type H+-transporting ATPase subunit b